MEPIPILSYGALTALGPTTQELWPNLVAGKSGLGLPSEILPHAQCAVGEVSYHLADLPSHLLPYQTRCNRLLAQGYQEVAPSVEMLKRRVPISRIGVVCATSVSGNSDLELAYKANGDFAYPYHQRQSFGCLASLLRQLAGLRGPAYTVSTACSSGANAIISAGNLIHAGICDGVLIGAADPLCRTTFHGFQSLGAMDPNPCRPFDRDRKGMSIGEGAAFLLMAKDHLEGSVGHPRLFWVGGGASSDAHHMTAPKPDGEGAASAMAAALESADLKPNDIGYVNLHGTGTSLNDMAEAQAVVKVLGHQVLCSSTKGCTGHLLGAAAALEAVIVCMALGEGMLPANTNLQNQDPETSIRVLKASERAPGLRYAMSNAFAFGGNNTSLIFGVRS